MRSPPAAARKRNERRSVRGAICTSCGAKRTAVWAAWFVDELTRRVPHWQVVITLLKLLRPYFKFERSLLTDLARCVRGPARAHGAARRGAGPPGVRRRARARRESPQLQPHVHLIVTSGAFDASGARFYRLPTGFLKPLEALVRERVLRELAARGRRRSCRRSRARGRRR